MAVLPAVVGAPRPAAGESTRTKREKALAMVVRAALMDNLKKAVEASTRALTKIRASMAATAKARAIVRVVSIPAALLPRAAMSEEEARRVAMVRPSTNGMRREGSKRSI